MYEPLNVTVLPFGMVNTRDVDEGTDKSELPMFTSAGIGIGNVLPSPLVNTMFGDEYDAVTNNEPVLVVCPTALEDV
jgi:hypothetical protein